VADYNLVAGDFEGESYAYEVWVIPLLEPAGGSPPMCEGSPLWAP
jgi:hypothetical protein